MHGKIKMLDEETIATIAAGEIIERPASIVKELIENSIDAGSKNIIVEIKNGGKEFIRVTDDGIGINEDEIDLAFLRYSTSKISNIYDLQNIQSLGFRGEALASIAMAGKLESITKSRNSTRGIRVFLENGQIVDKQYIGCPSGTSMIVRELFYNIPVRKIFLKKDIIESNYVNDIVYKLALGNPNISFKYLRDNKVILKTPGNGDIMSSIYAVLGKDFVDNLFQVSYDDDYMAMKGFISKNNFYRGNRSHQYIFINNRWVKNSEIARSIEECYKSLIPINRFPVFILFIYIDPKMIDVNIHPTKQEIKFINQKNINVIIQNVIRKKLKKIISIPNIEISELKTDKTETINFLDQIDIDDIEKEDNKSSIADDEKAVFISNYEKKGFVEETFENYDLNKHESYDDSEDTSILDIFNNVTIIGILFNTYIVLEDKYQKKFYILDQHAAHERVMYEKYKSEYESEDVVTQILISPEIINLTSSEMEVVKENSELFNKLGFEIGEFGLNTIAIRGVPLVFGKPKIKELFFDILDNLKLDLKSSYDVKIEKIMKIACSNAIKGGDKISIIEIKELLNQLSKTNNPYTCPHGRPVIVKISRKELEKKFNRIN